MSAARITGASTFLKAFTKTFADLFLFFGLLLIYTFKVIALSGAIYLSLIPISFLHYQKIKKQKNAGVVRDENDDLEDIL